MTQIEMARMALNAMAVVRIDVCNPNGICDEGQDFWVDAFDYWMERIDLDSLNMELIK